MLILIFIAGDDISALRFYVAGGKGVISVTANVAPQLMHDMCAAALNNAVESATELQNKLMPLHKQLFVESNPIPVKWALHEMGMITEGIRLPLTVLASQYHEKLRIAMQQTELV